LFDAITDVRTLSYAAWRAAAGKRERSEVRAFLSRLDEETGRLSNELRNGSFRFGVYRTFPIRDPKTRLIHAPAFCDRVVHHAIVSAAGPIFERGAISSSYACRAGRGQHLALRQARSWVREGGWFFKADVSKYYDSVDHGILTAHLERRFREQRLLGLFSRLLESYSYAPGKGLPIGALTSQYLGNFYLDPFDHWVKQTCRVRRYMRYMDDLLFVGGRDDLDRVRKEIPAPLEGLGLRVKNEGVLNRCELGVPYLGFVLYPDRMRLNARGRRRLRRKTKDLERGFERGDITERELQARAEALFAHARFADDTGWRRIVTSFSRLRETQEPVPRDARRFVEQHREQVPLRVSQQEQAR
jgi:hypothetical protein